MRIKNIWKSEVKIYELGISLNPGEISRELNEREIEIKDLQKMVIAGWLVFTEEKPIVYGMASAEKPSEPKSVSASDTIATVDAEREPLLAAQQPEESTIIVPSEIPGEAKEKTISEIVLETSAQLKETLAEKEPEELTKEDLLWQSKHWTIKKSSISKETDLAKLERILKIDKNENIKKLCKARLDELKGI